MTHPESNEEQLLLQSIEALIENNEAKYEAMASSLLDLKKIQETYKNLLVEYSLRDNFAILKISHDDGSSFLNLAEQFLGSDQALVCEVLVDFFARSQARLNRDYELT